LLDAYQAKHGKALKPVKTRGTQPIPSTESCPHCHAPHQYLYRNNGKEQTQLQCKICSSTFQSDNRFRRSLKSKYFCPYCQRALFRWKTRLHVIIHKCGNDNCPHRLNALKQLNPKEQNLRQSRSSQFKLCYIYREYLFQANELKHSAPLQPTVDITKIHNSQNILGLILAFYVSFAITARKTAYILRVVFGIKVSYQTVLNYAEAASFYCHQFNMKFKGPIDPTSAADETYVKITGLFAYVFLVMSSRSLKITAYHVADNRETQPAIIALNEAVRTAEPHQEITIVSDGNPAYPDAIHFLNEKRPKELPRIRHREVIGLQNLDEQSARFRPFKELIERLNRTFKFHVRSGCGFKSKNGAVALTTLVVTHYNFLRPHMSLNYRTPVEIPELKDISTIQGQWIKILSLAV
jgi:transposase-like protein